MQRCSQAGFQEKRKQKKHCWLFQDGIEHSHKSLPLVPVVFGIWRYDSTAVESSCLPSSVALFTRIYTTHSWSSSTPPPPRSESHSCSLFCRTGILSPGSYWINLKCCGKYPSSVIPPLFSSLLSSPSSWSKHFWVKKINKKIWSSAKSALCTNCIFRSWCIDPRNSHVSVILRSIYNMLQLGNPQHIFSWHKRQMEIMEETGQDPEM